MAAKQRLDQQNGKPAASATARAKTAAKNGAASYVLSAPNGFRTISRKQIKAAVAKVFRDRLVPND